MRMAMSHPKTDMPATYISRHHGRKATVEKSSRANRYQPSPLSMGKKSFIWAFRSF